MFSDSQIAPLLLLKERSSVIRKTLKQLQAESNERDAKLYTTMFARLSNENSSAAKVVSHSTSPEWKESFTWAFNFMYHPRDKSYISCAKARTHLGRLLSGG